MQFFFWSPDAAEVKSETNCEGAPCKVTSKEGEKVTLKCSVVGGNPTPSV